MTGRISFVVLPSSFVFLHRYCFTNSDIYSGVVWHTDVELADSVVWCLSQFCELLLG